LSVIREAAAKPKATVRLVLEGDSAVVRVEAMPSGEPSEVVLAIAESGLTSHPTRGENEGRALPHTAVVRSLRVLGEARSGAELAAKLLLSPNWNRAALKVVV